MIDSSNFSLYPHDYYFERVFKVRPVMLQLMGQIFNDAQRALLDTSSLALASESFISPELAESLSDLIYVCNLTGGQKIRVCLLFEHKSNHPGRRIYPQVLRYMTGMQEEDINQGREHFTLSIVVLFYHGKDAWNPRTVLSQYGPIPPEFHAFAPNFNFLVVNLQRMPDEQIMAMEDALLLRNIYLAMKHAREDDFFRKNYKKVFIFADENVSEDILLSLFESTFIYIQTVTTLKKEEIMQMVQTLPPDYERRAKTPYEQFVEEGLAKGLAKGLEKGLEEGLEKGLEKGIALKEKDFTLRLWEMGEFPLDKIASLVGITEQQVVDIILSALQENGQTLEETQAVIAAYQEKTTKT